MADVEIYELKQNGKRYRAKGMAELLEWAVNFNITLEDEYRPAGDDEWIPVTDNPEFVKILDPANWWTVTQKNGEFIAHDWDTVLKWTREGRLTKDVKIEGPQTPPGGMLGIASPELAPYLKEPIPDEPVIIPPKLRIDGKEYLPGSEEILEEWIRTSRVPLETEISIDDGDWEPILQCGKFDESLWPSDAVEARDAAEAELEEPEVEETPDSEETDEPVDAEEIEESAAEAELEEPAAEEETEEPADEEETEEPADEKESEETEDSDEAGEDILSSTFTPEDDEPAEPYIVITSTNEEYSLDTPGEVLAMFRRKEIRSFDEVRHSSLPDGMYVSDFVETVDIHSGVNPGLIIAGILCAIAAVLLIVYNDYSPTFMIAGGIILGITAFIFFFKSFLTE